MNTGAHINFGKFSGSDLLKNALDTTYHYLTTLQQSKGYIIDSRGELPPEQYNTSFYCFSSVIRYAGSGDSQFLNRAFRALEYLDHLCGERDVNPDSLVAFLISYKILQQLGCTSECVKFGRFLQKHHSYVHYDGPQSNNYITMQRLSECLGALWLDGGGDYQTASAKLREDCLTFMTEDGMSFDWPRRAGGGERNFSLSYHSRYLFVMALYCYLCNDSETFETIRPGFAVYSSLIPSDGECAYYGRSLNTLFGVSNAVAAFKLYERLSGTEPFSDTLKRVESYLVKYMTDVTGALRVVPNRFGERRCGYDDYVYDTVYQAYGLAILDLAYGLAPNIRGSGEVTSPGGEKAIVVSESSGLAKLSSGRTEVGMSLNPSFMSGYHAMGGLKYAAFTPLFIKINGEDRIPSLPHIPSRGRWSHWFTDIAYLNHPFWAGGFPVLWCGKESILPGKMSTHEFGYTGNAVTLDAQIHAATLRLLPPLSFAVQRCLARMAKGNLNSRFQLSTKPSFQLHIELTPEAYCQRWKVLDSLGSQWQPRFYWRIWEHETLNWNAREKCWETDEGSVHLAGPLQLQKYHRMGTSKGWAKLAEFDWTPSPKDDISVLVQ